MVIARVNNLDPLERNHLRQSKTNLGPKLVLSEAVFRILRNSDFFTTLTLDMCHRNRWQLEHNGFGLKLEELSDLGEVCQPLRYRSQSSPFRNFQKYPDKGNEEL